MATEPVARPHLHVVEATDERIAYDSASGQVCPNCEILRRDRDVLEIELRQKRRKITELQADKERLAENHERWAEARELWLHYQAVCGKGKSKFTPDRFWLMEPWLRRRQYGREKVLMAIDGMAFQSWVSERSNGTLRWHVDLDRVLESADALEERCNRAPRGWSLIYSVEMESWSKTPPTLPNEWHGIRPPEGWSPPQSETSDHQTALIPPPEEI